MRFNVWEQGTWGRALVGEAKARGRSGGSVVVGPVRARERLDQVKGEFFGRRIWMCLLLMSGFAAMFLAGVDGVLLAVAALVAIASLGCTLMWISRLGHWWRLSKGW